MINIAICDDNMHQRNIMKKYIGEITTDKKYKILEFESGEALMDNFPEDVSIIFLDIQMKEVNGMEVARWIRTFNNDVEIIFITGLIDYVQEGYEVRAYRYLLKPVVFEELKKHLTTCLDEIQKDEEDDEESLHVSTKVQTYRIPIREIKYIEVYRKSITIFTDSKDYNVNLSLEKVEVELKEHKFFRCHKSYLVNMSKIVKITATTVIIENGEVPLSRYRVKELKEELAKVLGDIIC